MTKREALLDLLHRADVTLSYWDSKRSGAVERELTTKERMMLISALRRSSALPANQSEANKLADFIELEALPAGNFTTMRFGHDRWSMIVAALRALALTGEKT